LNRSRRQGRGQEFWETSSYPGTNLKNKIKKVKKRKGILGNFNLFRHKYKKKGGGGGRNTGKLQTIQAQI
jgi:hypothetical protein